MPTTSNGGDSCQTDPNSQVSDSSHNHLQSTATTTTTATTNPQAPPPSSGYYDAEKCRAYIASRIKINKIARFATQVNRAIEIENSIQVQLESLFTQFLHQVALEAKELHRRCKSLKAHTTQLKKRKLGRPSKRKMKTTGFTKLAHHTQTINHRIHNHSPVAPMKDEHTQHHPMMGYDDEDEDDQASDTEADDRLIKFEADSYMRCLEQSFEYNMDKSRYISSQLNSIRQVFEKLASEHRDKVDVVHAIEEERQGTSVVRRSTYNLSIAANRATSIPVRVTTTTSHLMDHG